MAAPGMRSVTAEMSLTALPVVAGSWPVELRAWFCGLMAGQPRECPDFSRATWNNWLAAVEEQGVASLLFSHLRQCDSAVRPPAEIFEALKAIYFAEVARIMIRRTQLDSLLARLGAVGIEALVLKGAALGEMVYEDVFQRPSADIDILVRKEDYERARTVLLENGYRSKRGDRSGQMGWVCDEEFVPVGHDEARQYVVELHWALTSHAQLLEKIETEMLFDRAGETAGLNRSIRVLPPVDALVFACLHLFYKHIKELRLIWLYDIHLLAEQVERLGLWREAVALSQQWQSRLALKHCLELARDWFETPFPEMVSDPACQAATLEESELFNLAVYQLEHGRREGWLKKHLFQFKRLEGWDKFYYLRSRLLPTRQEIEANYPRLRVWPGPLVHIGRLAMMFVSKK